MTNRSFVFIKSLSTVFLRALYWGIDTLVTSGFGDISAQSMPEILISPLCFYIGYSGVCFLLAVFTNMIKESNKLESEFLRKMDDLKEYMNYRHLPREIQAKIRYSSQYFWNLLKGMDEESFLSELPATLYSQVIPLLNLDCWLKNKGTDWNAGVFQGLYIQIHKCTRDFS